MFDFDLLVIGAGSGGVRAARMAAAKGVKVAIVEERYFGGTCVNVGCVPKKLMVYGSQFAEEFENAAGFGWQVGDYQHDWSTLIANKDQEIARLNGIYLRLLESAGVTVIRGRARLRDAHSVEVDGRTIGAEKILIAVGGTPVLPTFAGAEYCFTSDQVFYLPQRPQRIAIVGGGYIGLEFSGIFNGLKSETHLLLRSQLLRGYDATVAQFVKQEMSKKGVNIHEHCQIEKIEKQGDAYCCYLTTGETLVVDAVMYAAGRRVLTDDLGLEHTHVQLRDNGTIIADERFQTAEPSIFALGDVLGTPELTPVALAQAMVFVDQQYGENTRQMSYQAIPTAIFCQPNYSFVGLSEEEVKQQGIACDVYVSEFRPMKHTLSGSEERVLMKMLVSQADDKVLGVHVVGSDAGELIQGFAVVVKAGLTKAMVDSTIGIHPTMAEELVTLREKKYSC